MGPVVRTVSAEWDLIQGPGDSEVSDQPWPQGPDSALASGRTPGSQPLKQPLLSKETSSLELLISRASLAAETPQQIPTVAVPAHSIQEAGFGYPTCSAMLGTGHAEAEQSSKRGCPNLTGTPLQSLTCRASGSECLCAFVQYLKNRKASHKKGRRPWGTSPPNLFLGSAKFAHVKESFG